MIDAGNRDKVFSDMHAGVAVIHRFIHIRPLYKYVHSLHHKNSRLRWFLDLAAPNHPSQTSVTTYCSGP